MKTENTKPDLILLIDDDEDDLFFHRKAIQSSGVDCKIDVCTSGDTAMDYLSNQGEFASRGDQYPQPSVIFLDINMPRVNGWQFLELYDHWLIEKRRDPSTIIVMLSTSIREDDILRAEATPLVDRYVSKPLKSDGICLIFDELFPIWSD